MSRLLLEIYPERPGSSPGGNPPPPILICAPNGDSLGTGTASTSAQPVVLRIHDGGCAIQQSTPSRPSGATEPMGLGEWHQAGGWRFRITHAVQAEADGSVGDNPSWAAPEIRITTYDADRVKRLRCMLPVEEGSQLVIGRGGTGTDLIVEDEHVSRVHSRFFVQNGQRLVEDMGSRWGTKLNGESLTDPKPLKHGDEIRIGKSTIHYICYWDILPEGPKHQGASASNVAPPPAPAEPPAPPKPEPSPAPQAKPPEPKPAAPQKAGPDDKTKIPPPPPAKADAPKLDAAKKSYPATNLQPPPETLPEPEQVWSTKPAPPKRNYLGFDVGGAVVIILLVLAGLVYLGYLVRHIK